MKREAGFTLTELMTVSAIVAILLAIGVPAYKNITVSYRMSAEVNNLLGDLMLARGEALKEGTYVTACVSSNGTSCTAGAWQNGWIVFSNPTLAANPAAGTLLKMQAPFGGTDTFVANTGVTSITYNREGFAWISPGGFLANTLITLHNSTAAKGYTRCLAVTPQGMTYTETPATSISAVACN
jgi:type IV fimbrial biogenesis protein FimT